LTELDNKSKSPPQADLLGQRIGDYQVLRRLGSGGMADVYLADQISLRRKVALKVLKAELEKDEGYVKRFVREAQAAAALVQSNIVQIYEVGQKDGVHYIAQEYIPGRNLRQFIARFGAVQPAMALNVLRQTGQALQKAGEFGVIHRDIKPENIMLNPNGEVKVTDFGLARIQNNRQKNDLTQIGIAMGTPLYMSPEQVEGRAVDPRSDIYSLGVTAWHMLAGYPPFDGENALSVALQHVRVEPEDLQGLRPDVPPELCAIIKKMMAKDPANRHSNSAELLRELRTVHMDLDGELDSIASKLAESRKDVDDSQANVSTTGLAATRQLQHLMRDNDRVRLFWRRTTIAAIVLAVMGVVAGALVAWINPPRNLLVESASAVIDAIPKEATAEKQYRAALWANTREHFLAVERYFPPDKAEPDQHYKTLLFNRQAWLQLGIIYLQDDPILPDAYVCFEKLESADETALYFQVSGKAGLAIFLDSYNSNIQARRYLMEIEDSKGIELLDEALRSRVRGLFEKYNLMVPGFTTST